MTRVIRRGAAAVISVGVLSTLFARVAERRRLEAQNGNRGIDIDRAMREQANYCN